MAVSVATVLSVACANFNGIGSTAQIKSVSDYTFEKSVVSSGEWPQRTWVADIGGEPLVALVDEALAGNPDIQIAKARLKAALAISEEVIAERSPSVGGELNNTYQRYSENGSVSSPLAGHYRLDNELKLNFSYDFDFWGKHAAALRAAVSHAKAVEADRHSAELILTAAVAHTWVKMAQQYDRLDLVEEELRVQDKILQLTQQRILIGLDVQTDYQKAQIQWINLRSEMIDLRDAIHVTRIQLAALIGAGPDRAQQIKRAALPVSSKGELPGDLTLNLLGRRPDVVSARWRIESALADVDHAKSEFYPDVKLLAFSGLSSLGLENFLSTGSRIVGIGPAISLPIFDGGRLRAKLKNRVADFDAAVASYNQALGTAVRDVVEKAHSLQSAHDQIEAQKIATTAASMSFDTAKRRQRAGTYNSLQVLAAEASWLVRRKFELDTKTRAVDIQIDLIKALGGGFQESGPRAPSISMPVGERTGYFQHAIFSEYVS